MELKPKLSIRNLLRENLTLYLSKMNSHDPLVVVPSLSSEIVHYTYLNDLVAAFRWLRFLH